MNSTLRSFGATSVASLTLTALTLLSGPTLTPETSASAAPAPATLVPAGGMEILFRIDGVRGTAQSHGYEDWIHADSLEFSLSQPATAVQTVSGGGAGGRVGFEPLRLTGDMTAAMAFLLTAAASGREIPEIEIVYLYDGIMPFTEFKLEDVHVRKIGRSTEEGSASGTTVELEFSKIEWASTYYDPNRGWRVLTERAGWDLAANRPV